MALKEMDRRMWTGCIVFFLLFLFLPCFWSTLSSSAIAQHATKQADDGSCYCD